MLELLDRARLLVEVPNRIVALAEAARMRSCLRRMPESGSLVSVMLPGSPTLSLYVRPSLTVGQPQFGSPIQSELRHSGSSTPCVSFASHGRLLFHA
jgi:hypothetical protein